MEILLLVVACFVAWRVYVAYLKKKAYAGYAKLAASGDDDEARAEYARVFGVLVSDFLGAPRLPPAQSLYFFDWARFLRCRIEHGLGTPSERELTEAGRSIRMEIAANANQRQVPPKEGIPGTEAPSTTGVDPTSRDQDVGVQEIGLQEAATTTSGPQPRIIRSTRDRSMDIHGYHISFYREVTFDTGEEAPCVMVVFDPTPRCRLIVTVEQNASAAISSERSHFLCAWTPEKRINYGAKDAYSDFDEFVKFATLVAVRIVFVPDGVEIDGADSRQVPERLGVGEREVGAVDKVGSMIDWAIDRSPVIEIVRRFGGQIGESFVRQEALALFQHLSRGDAFGADALLNARRAVQLSIHKWVNDHIDHLSPEAFQTYLTHIESD